MCSFLWVTNIPLCIYTTTSLSIPRFWVFFLSHTAPGFQLWFYFHLYMWVAHWGLAPEAALGGLGLPLRGPGVEVVPLLGSQGFWPHQVLRGGVVARAAGNAVLRKGVATSGGQQAAVFWPGGSPLRQRPGRRSLRGRRVGQDGSDPEHKPFVCLWQPCPSESWLWRWCSRFARGDPGRPKGSGT